MVSLYFILYTMQRFKRILTWALLIFVAAAIVATFRPRETVIIPDGISLLFWHAEKRCSNCRNIEDYIDTALQDREDFRLFKLEYDVAAYQPLARQFNVGRATIILLDRREGQNVRTRDLSDEVWKNIASEAAFVDMLRKELDAFSATDQ